MVEQVVSMQASLGKSNRLRVPLSQPTHQIAELVQHGATIKAVESERERESSKKKNRERAEYLCETNGKLNSSVWTSGTSCHNNNFPGNHLDHVGHPCGIGCL